MMARTASRDCNSVLSSPNEKRTTISEYGKRSLRPYPPKASNATFWAGWPAKARRHISIRMRSTTADRRRIAAAPSPAYTAPEDRLPLERLDSSQNCLRGLPKQEGIVNSIRHIGREGYIPADFDRLRRMKKNGTGLGSITGS